MDQNFFLSNRQKLATSLHGVIILGAYSMMQRGNDMAAAFEQEANFWWATGINDPDWWMILDTHAAKAWLVRPEVSEAHALFDGSLSDDIAKAISGIDDIVDKAGAKEILAGLAKVRPTGYVLFDHPDRGHFDFVVNPAQQQVREAIGAIFTEVKDCRRQLARLRAVKQPEEIAAIRKAIAITITGFEEAKKAIASDQFEYEIEALFSYQFRRLGAAGHAYDPIVAAGNNACTLHYSANNDPLKEGELLLLDIGAKIDGYAADITRTYAVGAVSERHKSVHAAVEGAHQKIIALLRPGLLVKDYSENVDTIMKEALDGLGLISEPSDYRRYFPHAISHGLGIDVHDSLGGSDVFLPGMVLTVEPGIYIPEERIGIRIEDDLLITKDGHENLSAALATGL